MSPQRVGASLLLHGVWIAALLSEVASELRFPWQPGPSTRVIPVTAPGGRLAQFKVWAVHRPWTCQRKHGCTSQHGKELLTERQQAGAHGDPAVPHGVQMQQAVPHARKVLQGATLVQGSGERSNAANTALLLAPPPPPPPPPFVIIPAPLTAPANSPASEPLSIAAMQAAPLPELVPAPEPAALPAASADVTNPEPAPDPATAIAPTAAPAATPATSTVAQITPAPTKAALRLPTPGVTRKPTAEKLVAPPAASAASGTPGPANVPAATPQPTSVPGAGVPVQPPPPPIKNPTPADLALAAGPTVEMPGSLLASPLAPPAQRRAPFTPIAAPQGACSSPYSIISSNPQLSRFTEYIKANSLQGALSPSNQSITVLAPVNDAFNVRTFEMLFYGCTNVTCLLNVHPEVGRSLIAYATLPESVPSVQLTPGSTFNTTAAISLAPITIAVAQPNPLTGQLTLDGKGSDAAVLQGDLPACGANAMPSYVHVVDTVLLPFLPSMTGRPNAAGTAYSATAPTPATVQLSPPAAAVAAPGPEVGEIVTPVVGEAPAADADLLQTPEQTSTVEADLLAAGGGRRRQI